MRLWTQLQVSQGRTRWGGEGGRGGGGGFEVSMVRANHRLMNNSNALYNSIDAFVTMIVSHEYNYCTPLFVG